MAGPYSITIQVAYPSLFPFSPGHVAVVVNTPDEQVYAGFGPANHDASNLGGMWAPGQFDVQTVPRGVEPMSHDRDSRDQDGQPPCHRLPVLAHRQGNF
jgi:hypothetical protein